MSTTTTIALDLVARELKLSLGQVENTLALLDAGNTVPFITRYRKDATGGLDEEQIRRIAGRVERLRMLAERKQTILRLIDSQGKLTPQLAAEIEAARNTKWLDDIYLPYRPKKQTLATAARERGLAPLAREILSADPLCANLEQRAADFINEDLKVATGADAILGAGHILAEQFGEAADLRQRLRKILRSTGMLVSVRNVPPGQSAATAAPATSEPATSEPAMSAPAPSAPAPSAPAVSQSAAGGQSPDSSPGAANPAADESSVAGPSVFAADAARVDAVAAIDDGDAPAGAGAEDRSAASQGDDSTLAEPFVAETSMPAPLDCTMQSTDLDALQSIASAGDARAESVVVDAGEVARESGSQSAHPAILEAVSPGFSDDATQQQPAVTSDTCEVSSSDFSPPALPKKAAFPKKAGRAEGKRRRVETKAERAKAKKLAAAERLAKSFSDYFDFREPLAAVPPHRVLAMNRGERLKVLRIRMEADAGAMQQAAYELLVPADHPHADFLRGCAGDALDRLVIPSLHREMRRELTEKADEHALAVFARNLRNLLLGPPVSGRRVLAVDPGFRSGCKLAVLDQFGSPQEHDVVHIIGSAEQRAAARKRLAELIRKHGVHIIAIGNGTACRESEQVVADMIGEEFADGDVAYVIVNEAGASHYSTSSVAREEFPDYDATLRSAVSIGRRLLDPLSELVKIDPANIGVGMYQHDLKAKHLRDSLSAVVESCVNYVGVDLNTASVDLLRYVSGLNQLTARRIYEYRAANGPFRSREQLLNVPALGEATFVQAAGFLKIAESENPLDVTWIHPESYNVTRAILGKLEASPSDLLSRERAAALKKKSAELNVAQCAAELDVGVHLVRDILSQIGRPGRDPREDLHPPLFKRGILKLEDLTPGMELSGSVLNVVDFGAFVDVGLHDSGLIHVSKLANHFVNDPHAVVAVGDIVKVWVTGVDLQRRRVSLTMIAPGTERPPPGRSARPKRSERSGRQQGTSPPRRRDTRSTAQRSGGPPHERKPRPKPKPLVPLTKAMEDGKEPMRTFGDLVQFFTKKKDIDKPDGDTSK